MPKTISLSIHSPCKTKKLIMIIFDQNYLKIFKKNVPTKLKKIQYKLNNIHGKIYIFNCFIKNFNYSLFISIHYFKKLNFFY